MVQSGNKGVSRLVFAGSRDPEVKLSQIIQTVSEGVFSAIGLSTSANEGQCPENRRDGPKEFRAVACLFLLYASLKSTVHNTKRMGVFTPVQVAR